MKMLPTKHPSKPTEKCAALPCPGSPRLLQGPAELTGVNAVLQNQHLWEKFAEKGTEMIITKVGRRMFPTLQVTVSGLEPETLYFALMDMVLAVDGRLRFTGGKWERVVADDGRRVSSTTCCYVHPESPAPGSHWMARPVSMQRAKMTNSPTPQNDNSMALMSMYMYQPRVHVVKASDFMALAWSPRATFTFPVTQFVAVTAYQNKRITAMKINHNPFAKGFRDKETLRSKRDAAQQALALVDSSDAESSQPPPAKRSRRRSTLSLCEDSGVSSMGSTSPGAAEVQEPPLAPLPWEYFAWSAAQLAFPLSDLTYPYQLWKYPFLFPPPPPLVYNPYLPGVVAPPRAATPVTTSH